MLALISLVSLISLLSSSHIHFFPSLVKNSSGLPSSAISSSDFYSPKLTCSRMNEEDFWCGSVRSKTSILCCDSIVSRNRASGFWGWLTLDLCLISEDNTINGEFINCNVLNLIYTVLHFKF